MAESLDDMKYALAMRPTKQLDEHGLYSRAAEVARQLPQEKGTPQQMLAMIAKAKGVKPDEIKYSGVQNAFANNPTVNKDELAQYFEQERPKLTIDESQAKKYADYSTEGGHGYRANVYAMTSPMAFGGDRPIFQQGSHWNTTNPVVHYRTKEFDDIQAVKATKPKIPKPDKTLSVYRKDTDDRENVPAWSTGVNGLSINKSLDNPKNYNITHDHSGLVVSRDIPTFHGAQNAVKDLGVVTDWTLPKDELLASLKQPETNNIRGISLKAQYKNSDYHVILPTADDYAKAEKKYGAMKRHFLLDELQSDWGQTARKNGIKSPEDTKELEGLDSQYNELQSLFNREFNNKKHRFMNGMQNGRTPEERQFWTNEYTKFFNQAMSIEKKISELDKRRSDINKKMSDAPFIGNTQKWTDLGLKTALYQAAKGGHDTFAWTPGQVNADRYKLSNHVDEIHYNPERKQFFGKKKGRLIFNRISDPQELEGLVGKEVAQKLLSTEPVDSFHQLKGEDLSVGGKGMIDYYDNILPKRALALAREHDPEAKLTSVKSPDKNINGYHAIEITPTMRKSILDNGFGVYRDGGTIHKADGGSILTRSKSMDTISPSVAHMKQALMNKQNLFNIQQTGVEQAPNMTPKMYISPDPTGKTFLPPGGVANKQGLPIGGVDMNTQQQGQQLNPQQPPQALPSAVKPPPQGAPQQPMPPPQGAPQPPQGLPPPTGMLPQAPQPPMGNMLQMTPQGRAMGAMQPQQMSKGGSAKDNLKSWFGNSKIVDEKGNPKVLYHGSINPKLKEFSLKHAMEVPDAFFFTDNPDVAHQYAYERAYGDIIGDKPSGRVYNVHLKMENPYEHQLKPNQKIVDSVEMGKAIQHAKKNGHDGMIVRNIDDSIGNTGDMGDVYVAFHPNQIKSADENKGSYSQKTNNINLKKGGQLSQEDMHYAVTMKKPVKKAMGGGISGSGTLNVSIPLNAGGGGGGGMAQGLGGMSSLGNMGGQNGLLGMMGSAYPYGMNYGQQAAQQSQNNMMNSASVAQGQSYNRAMGPMAPSVNQFAPQPNAPQVSSGQVPQMSQPQTYQCSISCTQAFAMPKQGGTPVCTSAGSTPQQVPTMPSLGMFGMGGLGKIPQPPPLTAAQQKVQDELQKWESTQGSSLQGYEVTSKLDQLNQQYDPTAQFIPVVN